MGKEAGRGKYIFITLITGIAYLTVFAHRFVPAVVAIDMSRDIGAGAAMLGMLSSGYFYMYGLSQMPYGVLVDHVGPRRIMTVSFLIAGLGGVLFAFSPSAMISFVARLILGLGCAAALVSSMTLLARFIPKDKFPVYLTVLYVIGGLGPLAAASPLALLSSYIGWRGACFSVAVFTFLYSAVLFAFVRDYPPQHVHIAKNDAVRSGMLSGIKTVAVSFKFWMVVIFGVGVPSIYLVYCGLWAGPFLAHVYGFDKQAIGGVLSFGAVGSVLGFLLGPLLSDKVLKSRPKAMAVFGCLLFICLLPFVLRIRLSFPLLCAQAALIGIFSCGSQPVAVMAIKDMFPLNITGTALGMFNTFPLLCGGFLQFLIGVILSAVSDGNAVTDAEYAYSFSAMVIACAAGVIAVFFVSDRKR